MNFKKLSILGTIVGIGLVAMPYQSALSQFYKGKTISVVVPSGAGGGLTRSARVFMKFMSGHIAGSPKMVIKNIPGGVKGHNFIAEKARPDGMTILWGPMFFAGVLTGAPGYRYDPEKFGIIGTGNSSFVTIIRKDTPPSINSAKDLTKITKTVVTGGIRPGGILDMFQLLSFDALGIPYRHVTGYRGMPKMNAAIRAKEIQALTVGHPGYHAFYRNTILKDGTAIPLFYHSPFDPKTGEPVRLPGRYPANIKHYVDAYKDIKGAAPSGAAWDAYKWFASFETWSYFVVAPPGTPKEAIAALRKAHAKVPNDPGFQAEWKKQFRDIPVFLPGEKAKLVAAQHKNVSPATLAYLKKTIAPAAK